MIKEEGKYYFVMKTKLKSMVEILRHLSLGSSTFFLWKAFVRKTKYAPIRILVKGIENLRKSMTSFLWNKQKIQRAVRKIYLVK